MCASQALPGTWGGIHFPEDRAPYAQAVLEALSAFAPKVHEQGLGPFEVKPYGSKIDTKPGIYGRRRASLRIEGEAVIVRLVRGSTPNDLLVTDRLPVEMADVLVSFDKPFGLDDVQALEERLETVVALRKLLAMPQVKRLIRPYGIGRNATLSADGVLSPVENRFKTWELFRKPEDLSLDYECRVDLGKVRSVMAELEAHSPAV